VSEESNTLWIEVYDELRNIARTKLRGEKPGQTLQATAIVNEVYLRLLVQGKELDWRSRGAFFVAAAQAMQYIFVDQARRKKAIKRDNGRHQVQVDPKDLATYAVDLTEFDSDEVLILHDGLSRLERIEPLAARVVQLKFFMGLRQAEIAESLDISLRTCDRLWAYARAWLYRYAQQNEH
jgi:RNA polymerase sigma factor (TIGR02999 family)